MLQKKSIWITSLLATLSLLAILLSNQPQETTKISQEKIVPKPTPAQVSLVKPSAGAAPQIKQTTVGNIVTTATNTATTKTVATTSKKTTQLISLTDKEYQYLAHAIHAEAGGEPFEGQVAVAAVLINRVRAKEFPKSMTANIFKPGEFESVSNGYIWSKPNASSYRAAELALKGWDPTNGALYFFNPAKSSSRWIWTRSVTHKIGNHWFAV